MLRVPLAYALRAKPTYADLRRPTPTYGQTLNSANAKVIANVRGGMRPSGAHPDHEVTDPGCCWILSTHVVPAHAKLRQIFFQPVGVIRLGFRRTRDGIQRAARIGQAVRLPAHLEHSLQLQRIEQVEL